MRVLTAQQNFKKEGATYSNKVYTVACLEGDRFVLKDEQGSKVKRRFSAGELLKVKIGMYRKTRMGMLLSCMQPRLQKLCMIYGTRSGLLKI